MDLGFISFVVNKMFSVLRVKFLIDGGNLVTSVSVKESIKCN